MAVYTDIAAELYPESRGSVPRGVKTFTATASGIGLTRVEIERSGLRRPKGRYITLDMPQFAAIDDRNEAYVWAIASQLRALLPKEGLVLVAGVGNRAVTADALGPETADRVFVTRHLCEHPDAGDDVALRPVAAFSPGVEGNTALPQPSFCKAWCAGWSRRPLCVWTACVPRTCAGWDAASSFPRQGFRPTLRRRSRSRRWACPW